MYLREVMGKLAQGREQDFFCEDTFHRYSGTQGDFGLSSTYNSLPSKETCSQVTNAKQANNNGIIAKGTRNMVSMNEETPDRILQTHVCPLLSSSRLPFQTYKRQTTCQNFLSVTSSWVSILRLMLLLPPAITTPPSPHSPCPQTFARPVH